MLSHTLSFADLSTAPVRSAESCYSKMGSLSLGEVVGLLQVVGVAAPTMLPQPVWDKGEQASKRIMADSTLVRLGVAERKKILFVRIGIDRVCMSE